MGGHGGARPGSGRKPTVRNGFEEEERKARAAFGAGLVSAAEHAVDLATGAYCFAVLDLKTGKYKPPPDDFAPETLLQLGEPLVRVYRQPPDLGAITLVVERIMGKVPQPVDVKMELALRQVFSDYALLARILQEHVPAEALGPIAAELERIGRHREGQAGLLGLPAG